jgi:5-methylcytosine-specific restriction protein A
MVYEKHHIKRAPDRDGNERDAVVFELRPLSAVVETTEETPESEPPRTLEQLRELAKAAAGIFPPTTAAVIRNIYQRSRDVRNYVLARAAGHCEGCKTPAPLLRFRHNRPRNQFYAGK